VLGFFLVLGFGFFAGVSVTAVIAVNIPSRYVSIRAFRKFKANHYPVYMRKG
jgi:hypothetical protein